MNDRALEDAGDASFDISSNFSSQPDDWSDGFARCAALVREIERNVDVNSLRFRGFRLWPRIRTLLLFTYAHRFNGAEGQWQKRYRTLTTLSKLASADSERIARGLESAKALDRLAKQHSGRPLAFLGATRRKARSGETIVDLLFDPLIDLVPDLRIVKIALGATEGDPAATREKGDVVVLNTDGMLAALIQLEPAHDLFDFLGSRSISNFTDLERALPDNISSDLTEAILIKDAASIHRLSIIFRLYLEKAKPPFILVSGQRRVNIAMTLAARQLGIATIDIQHGAAALSPHNIKWHSWTCTPDEGYELLPDYFWVWGRQAARLIDEHRNPRCELHRALVGGHPTLMSALPASLSEDYRIRAAEAEKTILVTLVHIKHGGLTPALAEAMAAAPGNWRWLLRMHPVDWARADARRALQSHLQSAGVRNYEMEETSSAFLHHVLDHADWHVTPYSSSAIEAASYGVPTVFVDPLASILFDYLLEQPGYYLAIRPDEITGVLGTEGSTPISFVERAPDRARAILQDLADRHRPPS